MSEQIANSKQLETLTPADKEEMKQQIVALAAKRFLTSNTALLRREVLERYLSGARDIDKECGYPSLLTIADYKAVFDRQGLGTRVVEVLPGESWSQEPEVYESPDEQETEFEKKWKEILDFLPVWGILHRADVLSGIGQYGLLLLGIDDGKDLSVPVDSVEQEAKRIAKPDAKAIPVSRSKEKPSRRLLYVRPFDQSVVRIEAYDKDVSSPRYGYPLIYVIKFETEPGSESLGEKRVHWTRVVHLADNRLSSEIFGVPRLQSVFNDLHNIRKVGGGGGEMFWRGGFPGFAFELMPEAAAQGAIIDKDSIREQMENWAAGLQRYLSVENLSTKSLQPQISDPTGHVKMYAQLIGAAKGIPWRLLLGTEEAKLASSQDQKTWNTRLMRRQMTYLTPYVIRPFIDRLIIMGVLPRPEKYFVEWPDLNAPGTEDKAKVAGMLAEAFSKYVGSGADALIPPRLFLTLVCGFSDEDAEAIEKALDEHVSDLAEKQTEESLEDEGEEDENTPEDKPSGETEE